MFGILFSPKVKFFEKAVDIVTESFPEGEIMKLSEKICDRKIAYLFKKEISLAFEIALLYFVLAKRKKTKAKIAEACLKSIFWLKQAEIKFPEYINKLSSQGQLELLIKILVNNKAKIGARRCLPVLPELCKQFGLL